MSTLSTHDKEHLSRVALQMNWHLIARVMKALGWQWYSTQPATPNAGQVRDEAMNHLRLCIHHARRDPASRARIVTGGLEYTAAVCPYSGEVESLRCAFVLEACDSQDYPGHYSLPA